MASGGSVTIYTFFLVTRRGRDFVEASVSPVPPLSLSNPPLNATAALTAGPEARQKSLTGLLFLLAAPLGSGVEHHLLHLVQLLLQTGEVEVCALLRHGCKVWGSTQNRPGKKMIHEKFKVKLNI